MINSAVFNNKMIVQYDFYIKKGNMYTKSHMKPLGCSA